MDLYIAASHWKNDLTPAGIVSYNQEKAIPASPVVLRSCGAMIVDKDSVVVVMLTTIWLSEYVMQDWSWLLQELL